MAIGVQIVRAALSEPLRQIANNAGFEGSIIVEQVKAKGPGIGFDVMKEEFTDMIQAGIMDPAKVTRTALRKCRQHRRDDVNHRSSGLRYPREKETGGNPTDGLLISPGR